jgi:hypothetical protein
VWLLDVQTSLLIDSILRQTTVLIARLSTASGLRAPLAHITSQLFLDLVRELEQQGLGRKVIADMFGLALRSYQQKVQRLRDAASDRSATLWEAVLGYLREEQTASRAQVLARFAREDGAMVRGVLSDLVASSLVQRTGSGDGATYRATPGDDALDGQWKTEVLEHFQAMVSAILAKLPLGAGAKAVSSPGSTFTFHVWPGHPHYEQVFALFERTRRELSALWGAVTAHNAQHPSPAPPEPLTLYFGHSGAFRPPAVPTTHR